MELAKRLKELGVKQESVHYWWNCPLEDFTPRYHIHGEVNEANDAIRIASAFTLAELDGMLPETVRYSREKVTADVFEGRGDWFFVADALRHETGRHTETADTEADARAKMVVYLIEKQTVA